MVELEDDDLDGFGLQDLIYPILKFFRYMLCRISKALSAESENAEANGSTYNPN